MIYNYICILLLALLVSLQAFASGHTQQISRVSVEEGLSQSAITDIVQDHLGFVWIGTRQGLNRHDGSNIMTVGAGVGLEQKDIFKLAVINQKYLLVSTAVSGTYLLDLSTYQAIQIYSGKLHENSPFVDPVSAAFGHNDKLVMAIGREIHSLSLRSFESTFITRVPEGEFISSLLSTGEQLLIATNKQLYRYAPLTNALSIIQYNHETESTENKVRFLKKDPSLGLLVGTVNGLYSVPLVDNITKEQSSELLVAGMSVWGHQITPFGEFIGTDNGLYMFDRKAKRVSKVFDLAQSRFMLSSTSITKLMKDKSDNLWMGTHGEGAYIWPSSTLRFDTLHEHTRQLSNNNVWAITEIAENLLLIGTDNGINAFNPISEKLEATYLTNSDPNAPYGIDAIHSIFPVDQQQQIYAVQTAINSGLFYRNENKFVAFNTLSDVEIGEYSWGLTKYPQQRFIFIGTKGFFEFDAKSGNITRLSGLSSKIDVNESFFFLPPLSPSNNNQYFVSTSRGLLRYDAAEQNIDVLYAKSDKQSIPAVESWIQDPIAHTIWLATSSEGLVELDSKTYEVKQVINQDRGLLSNTIYRIQIDLNGAIWFSSQRGLYKYAPNQQILEIYKMNHGLPSVEFNAGASAQLSNGKLIFGTVKGAVLFNPEDFTEAVANTADIQLTQLDILSSDAHLFAPRAIQQAMSFNYDAMGIEIGLSSFDFSGVGQGNLYANLEGPSNLNFKQIDNQHLFFNQLAPGAYTLTITKQTTPLSEPTSKLVVDFSVSYSPWRSPMAMAAYGFMIVLCLLLLLKRHRFKRQQLESTLKALTQANTQTQLALRSTQSGIWSVNLKSHKVTQERSQILGYKSNTISIQDHYNAIHPDEREIVETAWKRFISNPTKEHLSLSYRLLCNNGQWHWFHDIGQVAEYDTDGSVAELTGIYTNITEHKANQLKASILGEAVSQVNDWLLILDPQLVPISVNRSFCEAFNIDPKRALSELTVERFSQSIGQKKLTALIQQLKSMGPNQYLRQEVQVTDDDNQLHPVQLSISAISKDDATLQYFVVVVTDLTEQKQAENELRYLANFDSLTNLPNRNLMLQHIEFAIFNAEQSQSSCALLFIDLDKFKPINDAYGHLVGDKLLIAITERIKGHLDDNCILGRQSGDEFLLLVKQLSSAEYLSSLVTKLVQLIPEKLEIDRITVSVSASIGVAVYPFDANSAETLIRNADIAMIHSKQAGRNAFKFFTEQMNEEITKKLTLENALKTAAKDGQIYNHYQPIINTTTGQIAGVELLMRWQHEGVQVPPDDFIPIAEEVGMIEQLTEQALIRALTELRPMFMKRADFYVSLNLSAVHILRTEITQQFSDILTAHNLSNNRLRLEITESSFMSDIAKARTTLSEMKQANFTLLLDDFGTGYSSLTYLNEFPLDIIKIDQGFVRNMDNRSVNKSIIRTIYLLAQSLDMKCIAEGVETEQQLAFLRAIGCEYMQGYYFAKPMSAQQLLVEYSHDKLEDINFK